MSLVRRIDSGEEIEAHVLVRLQIEELLASEVRKNVVIRGSEATRAAVRIALLVEAAGLWDSIDITEVGWRLTLVNKSTITVAEKKKK